jgi:hypothetical protein
MLTKASAVEVEPNELYDYITDIIIPQLTEVVTVVSLPATLLQNAKMYMYHVLNCFKLNIIS